MLIDELRKRAGTSAVLRKLATGEKTAGLVGRRALRAAAHPLVTATAVAGGLMAKNRFTRILASMNPEAHKTMLGMNR